MMASAWALAKAETRTRFSALIRVDPYLMIATSYDLTFSTLAQFTSVRVVQQHAAAVVQSTHRTRHDPTHPRLR